MLEKAFTWKCFQDLDANTNKLHGNDIMADALLGDCQSTD